MMMTYKMAGHHADVDHGVDAGRGGMLWAIIGTVKRPNSTFRAISHDPGGYLASSVAVFAIVCLASVLQSTTVWLEPNGVINNYSRGAWPYAISLVNPVMLNFLIIAMIFWIGGRYGENRRFKEMFPMLSYCLVPMVFLAAASPGIHLLDIQVYMHDGGYLGGGSLDQDPDLSPSFALDFAGRLAIMLIQTAFTAFFMVWVLVLFVKAMKISHGFGTGKAVGVVALAVAATYALSVALSVVLAVLGELFLSPLSP